MSSESDLVTREVKPDVWTFSRPFLRAPLIPQGSRSTAFKLVDGSVFLYASTKVDDETLNKIREIGPVAYIAVPDVLHYLFLQDFHNAFPDAKVIAMEGIEEKVSTIKFFGQYGRDPPGTKYGFEDEITAQYFPGFVNKDVAYFHHASKTVVEADLLYNLPPTEQYSRSTERATSILPFVGRLYPDSWVHKQLTYSAAKDVKLNSVAAKAVDGWDFDMVIPCHGDVIDKNAKEAWRSIWGKYITYKE